MNRFWIILTVVIIGLIGLFFAVRQEDTNPDIQVEGDVTKVLKTDHVRGNKNADVVLIEYADFQCPGCAAYYPILKSLEETYSDRVAFVYRHFPLTQIHPNAFAAARAAEAAGKQGKFFEMHDKLFETQSVWGQATSNQQSLFEGYAEELGLDSKQFSDDYASADVADRINLDVSSGQSELEVNSTPTFILGGKKLSPNPQDKDAFAKLIEEQLKKTQKQN